MPFSEHFQLKNGKFQQQKSRKFCLKNRKIKNRPKGWKTDKKAETEGHKKDRKRTIFIGFPYSTPSIYVLASPSMSLPPHPSIPFLHSRISYFQIKSLISGQLTGKPLNVMADSMNGVTGPYIST